MEDHAARLKLQAHDRANLLTGVYFEDVDVEREVVQRFGRVKCIVDYHGIIAYSENVSLVLEKYFSCLSDDGRIFVKTSAWTRELGLYQSTVRCRDGSSRSLPEWLAQQQGVEARFLANGAICELRRHGGRGVQIVTASLSHLTPGTPPVRVFVEDETRYSFGTVAASVRVVGSDGELLPCIVLDASARGAALALKGGGPAVGSRVFVTLDPSFRYAAEGVVRWSREVNDGTNIGVQFGFDQQALLLRALHEKRQLTRSDSCLEFREGIGLGLQTEGSPHFSDEG